MIKTLDKDTCRLLDATVICSSPLEIMKSLIKQSVESGSTNINVQICNDMLSITDNGLGIDHVNRYIGESVMMRALGEVAEVEVVSRSAKRLLDSCAYKIDSGRKVGKMVSPFNSTGTIIKIRNLYYNVLH